MAWSTTHLPPFFLRPLLPPREDPFLEVVAAVGLVLEPSKIALLATNRPTSSAERVPSMSAIDSTSLKPNTSPSFKVKVSSACRQEGAIPLPGAAATWPVLLGDLIVLDWCELELEVAAAVRAAATETEMGDFLDVVDAVTRGVELAFVDEVREEFKVFDWE